jgi:hypothetical protein
MGVYRVLRIFISVTRSRTRAYNTPEATRTHTQPS